MMRHFLQRCAMVAVFCAINAAFFFAAWKVKEHGSASHRTLAVLAASGDNNIIKRALFSPDDNVQDILITLIQEEKESIAVAAFSLTNRHIAGALREAHKRGVKVELVADQENSEGTYSKVGDLIDSGLPVWLYNSKTRDQGKNNKNKAAGIMHHKFMVFKKTLQNRAILWTGSFNFTRSANDSNQENVVILDDASLIKAFLNQFEILKRRSVLAHKARIYCGVPKEALT